MIWKTCKRLMASCLGLFGIVAMAADAPLRDAVECTPRGGLPNFYAKCASGGEVKVAYLGGSITAQNGWRVQSLDYFRKQFPKAKFSEIHAAIGGTGSTLGAFRLEHDVLRLSPDLVFVEFAVNDASERPENIIAGMEGIVRKVWTKFPGSDICFVYTLTDRLLPDLQKGKFPKATTTMEQVADHYGIPSVHMGLEVARLEKEGKLQMKAPNAKMTQVSGKELDQNSPLRVDENGKIPFAQDGVHPFNDTGHRLYMEALSRSFPKIKDAGTPGEHKLPTALRADNLSDTVMLPIDKATLSGDWKKLSEVELKKSNMGKELSMRVPSLWKAPVGAEMSFRFKGSRAMMYDILGPEGGKLEITVDGKKSIVTRIDAYGSYNRLSTLPLASGLDPSQTHEVKIKVLGYKLDKEKNLMESRRGDVKANPAKYEPINWHAGAIFLVGELVQ